ncbi:MAG: 6-phosphogluconolactonase [Alkalispirochaeta sp.]
MAVEFVHHETEQRAADALFNELRHYLGHGPGYHAGSEDDPNGHSAADKTATAPYVIMLAGGSTPIEVYRRVSEHPPRHVHPAVYLMLSDDRYVPRDDERSNFGNIAPLLDDLGLPEERFVHVDTSLPVDEGVARFSGDIHALGRRSAIFALGVLGIGADGHTASLFSADAVPAPVRPGASETFAGGGMLLTIPGEAAAVTTGVHGGVPRVSVTPEVLLSFRKLIFFAPGAAKRDILYELSRRPEDYPAGRIMLHHPNASIWTDEAPRVR